MEAMPFLQEHFQSFNKYWNLDLDKTKTLNLVEQKVGQEGSLGHVPTALHVPTTWNNQLHSQTKSFFSPTKQRQSQPGRAQKKPWSYPHSSSCTHYLKQSISLWNQVIFSFSTKQSNLDLIADKVGHRGTLVMSPLLFMSHCLTLTLKPSHFLFQQNMPLWITPHYNSHWNLSYHHFCH